jgi:Fic-DOC domain mobile mystery protein B
MTDEITDQPEGATPLDDISGLLRRDITTRGQLDEAETLNILGAVDWIERGRLRDVFTVDFYERLHSRMYDDVWEWAGDLRSVTGARPNIGVPPEMVPIELGRVAMEFNWEWQNSDQTNLLPFIAKYHHALVWVHPFNNGNGRWSRLACDVVMKRLAKKPLITWATDTLNVDSGERSQYINALKMADDFDLAPLVEYLSKLNPQLADS